jgi:hypothetical protein
MKDEMPRPSHMVARTDQHPLMPAHAGIQLSPRNRLRLKKLDSRVRGNERVGSLAFERLGHRAVFLTSARQILKSLTRPLPGNGGKRVAHVFQACMRPA